MGKRQKIWIYGIIVNISNITFLFTFTLFFFYFILSAQGLSEDLAYYLIDLFSISAICTMIITVLKIVVNIIKSHSALKKIKAIVISVLMFSIIFVFFVIINSIYLLSNG